MYMHFPFSVDRGEWNEAELLGLKVWDFVPALFVSLCFCLLVCQLRVYI